MQGLCFLNSKAIANYVINKNPACISFVCTDSSFYDNEDYLCAAYIRTLIERKMTEFANIKKYLKKHPCAYGFIKKPLTKHSRADFNLCIDVDKFNFVIKAKKEDGKISLIRI